jgi:hypothetical protein
MRVVFPLFFVKRSEGSKKLVLTKVSILLTLFIFAMIVRAWGDPVKSIHGAAIQLTTMKVDENRAAVLKKTEPAEKSPEWSKKSQARLRDVNFLRTPQEKKRSQVVESLDKMISSREFSEKFWRNKFSSPLHAPETKSSSSDSGQSTLKANPEENGSLEQATTFTKLRLLRSKEETFKEIFMGICFSFDLTNGQMLLEMNVTPSSEKRSGFLIRF